MDPALRTAVAILRGRAIDMAIVAADLRANGLSDYNTERQSRQLEFNAGQVERGEEQTNLPQ